MRKKTIHREVLSDDLARPVLNATLRADTPLQGSAGFRLMAARAALAEAVAAANHELAASPLTEILAEHAMRQSGKRGFPRIVVDPDGSVVLEVHYDPPKVQPAPQVDTERRKSSLPGIEELRKRARDLGIDPTPFGKAKIRLQEAVHTAESLGHKPPAPAPKPEPPPAPKPAPAPAPPKPEPVPVPPKPAPRVPPPDTRRVIPDDDDEDVSSLFGSPTPKPAAPAPPAAPLPRRGVAAELGSTTPTPSLPPRAPRGRSLSAIVGSAETEVDVDALLKVPPPSSSSPPSD